MAFRQKVESETSPTITAEWLCELHQGNLDSERVFREASRVVSDESVAMICEDISTKRQRHAEELEEYLTEHECADHTSLATVMHRAWLDLRASFSSHNPKAVLSEVLRGERRLSVGYTRAEAALNGSPVLGLIRRHINENAENVCQLGELYTVFTQEPHEDE